MTASLRWSGFLLALLLTSFAGCESTDAGSSRPEAGSTATAAPADLGGIDEAVARVKESLDVYSYSSTGIVVRVRVGEQARTLVFGLASREPRRRLRASDTFQIGSVTKMMTATLVLQAVARGQLALDDTVDHWLPDLLDQGGEATLEQLLSHRSGLHDYVQMVKPGQELETPEQAIAAAARHPTSRPGKTATTPTPTSWCSDWSSRRPPAHRSRSCSGETSSCPQG